VQNSGENNCCWITCDKAGDPCRVFDAADMFFETKIVKGIWDKNQVVQVII
jgi:hypothetical protein